VTEPLFTGSAPRLWLRVEQDADKPYYARVPSTLADGFVVNANLVEHSPASVSAFLDQFEKPFIVDPMSYRFERVAWHTRERDGEIENKRNYRRLWEKYANGVDGLSGDPLVDRGTRRIASEQAALRFCANVIEFQDRRLRSAWLDDGAQYVGMDRMFGYALAPAAYVAPYRVVGEAEDPSQDIDGLVTLATATASLGRPPVVAVLPILGSVLEDIACMRRLAGGIGRSGAAVALIWPVGLTAFDLADSPGLFTGLTVLLRGLREAGLEAGMLYGGFYSTLLRGFGSMGFSHGLMYGESRGLEPAPGRPSTRFYFPPLHESLPYSIAEQLIAGLGGSEYLRRVCACDLCQALVADGSLGAYFATYVPAGSKRPFPTPEALDLNRMHYLFARGRELEFVRPRPETQLITDLLRAVDEFPPASTRVMRSWASRLNSA
jgi:hypothetical protein